MLTDPEDAIDPELLAAVDALMSAYSGDFQLGGLITQVDLLGAYGKPLGAERGLSDAGPNPVPGHDHHPPPDPRRPVEPVAVSIDIGVLAGALTSVGAILGVTIAAARAIRRWVLDAAAEVTATVTTRIDVKVSELEAKLTELTAAVSDARSLAERTAARVDATSQRTPTIQDVGAGNPWQRAPASGPGC
jgi:hypothetical protein